MTEVAWITPAEAERLVAAHMGVGALMSHAARDHLIGWVAQDQLKTMALEVTRWVDEPPAPQPSPPPTAAPVPADNDTVTPLPAYRVNGAFRLRNSWELPLVKTTSRDVAMSTQDWEAAAAAGADDSPVWSSSELTHRLLDQRHPNARVTYGGIRFSKADIERRIAIAGWPSPASASEPASTEPLPAADGTPMWSEDQMRIAIQCCGITNRDDAWRTVFGPKQSDHGWKNEAFRQFWSVARDTQGTTGRPPKRA